MDIGKLYETLTGEAYPYAPERLIEASWALSNRAGALQGLSRPTDLVTRGPVGARKRARPQAS